MINRSFKILSLMASCSALILACDSSKEQAHSAPEPETVQSHWQRTEIISIEKTGNSGLLSANVKAFADKNVPYWMHVIYLQDIVEDEDTTKTQYELRHLIWDNETNKAVNADEPYNVIATLDNSLPFDTAIAADNSLYATYRGGGSASCNNRQSDAMMSHRNSIAAQWTEYLGAIGDTSVSNPVLVDGDAGDYTSIAVDSAGNAHMVFQFYWEGCDSTDADHPDIRYVYKPFGDYDGYTITDEETVEGNNAATGEKNDLGYFNDLILDQNEMPVAFYFAQNIQREFGLRWARKTASGWNANWIDRSCSIGSISAALAPDGQPAVAYFIKDCAAHSSYTEDDGYGLRYAKYDGSEWSIEMVDEATRVGDYVALAFDANHHPVIAYYETTSFGEGRGSELFNLKLARFQGEGNGWFRQRTAETNDIGIYNSLWVDADNLAHIVTYSKTDKAIYHFNEKVESPQ